MLLRLSRIVMAAAPLSQCLWRVCMACLDARGTHIPSIAVVKQEAQAGRSDSQVSGAGNPQSSPQAPSWCHGVPMMFNLYAAGSSSVSASQAARDATEDVEGLRERLDSEFQAAQVRTPTRLSWSHRWVGTPVAAIGLRSESAPHPLVSTAAPASATHDHA